jgi:hypothetical protein
MDDFESWLMSIGPFAGRALTVGLAVGLLYVGLRGLLGRRPLVFSSRWFPAIMGVTVLRQLIPLADTSAGPGHGGTLQLGTLLLVVVFAASWYWMHGYMIFGVGEDTLRSALHHALGARGLLYEDRPGVIHIPSEQIDLRLQLNEWGGTASVKAAPARGKPLLRELGKDMKGFFTSRPISLRKNVFVVYTYIGALLVGIATLYMG